MSDLARLVETLFALRGFEAEPSAGGHVLRFRRAREHVVVSVREGADTLPAYVAREVADTLPALGRAVLVCLGDLGHEARSILERGAIDVWTRDKLVHELGKALLEAAEHGRLAGVLGARPGPEPASAPELPSAPPVAEVASDAATRLAAPVPAPPASREKAPSLWARPPEPRPAASPQPASSVPGLTVPAVALSPRLARPAPPSPAPEAPPRAPAATAEGTVLATTVDRESALRIGVGRLLRVDHASLELVPLHAFRYACRIETKGAPPHTKQGLLGVDAVTGHVRELAEPMFGTITGHAERLQALLPDLEASALAKRRIVEMHTQKVRMRSSLGRGALIVEDRVVRPEPRSIQLEPQGLWWLPVWRLEGHNGTLRVNAGTGAVEEERLRRAFATDAEFL